MPLAAALVAHSRPATSVGAPVRTVQTGHTACSHGGGELATQERDHMRKSVRYVLSVAASGTFALLVAVSSAQAAGACANDGD